ncbi:unnamed protein product [Prorocentrum cordatum]|uniref:Uncharacterized protein n=1 Tax=Prorocentrum cordatum TaxID=2364126 RepID=A0ABN9Q6V3_9DINO|nr:unnamed protein product [Polarella glacialis]
MDFEAVEQRNGRSGKSRALCRQELAALLQGELERLRAERDALAAERQVVQHMVPRRAACRSLEALADRLFALPSHELADHEGCLSTLLLPSDRREQWLRNNFLTAWEPHRRACDAAETYTAAKVKVLGIWGLYNPQLAKDCRPEAAHAGDCAPVPELEAAIWGRADLEGPGSTSCGGCVDKDEVIIFKLKQAVPQNFAVYEHESGGLPAAPAAGAGAAGASSTASLLGFADEPELDDVKDEAVQIAPAGGRKRMKLTHGHFFDNEAASSEEGHL